MRKYVKISFVLLFVVFGSCHFSENTTKNDKQTSKKRTQETLERTVLPIDFLQTNLEDVLKIAQKDDKIVFVDVYTNWCKPCKEMDKFVFSDARIGRFFNKNFVNFKLNAQTPENRKIARQYGVSAYPTLLFLDKNGEALLSSMGYIDAEMLLEYGKEILADQ